MSRNCFFVRELNVFVELVPHTGHFFLCKNLVMHWGKFTLERGFSCVCPCDMVRCVEVGSLSWAILELFLVLVQAVFIRQRGNVLWETNWFTFINAIINSFLVDFKQILNLFFLNLFPISVVALIIPFETQAKFPQQILVDQVVEQWFELLTTVSIDVAFRLTQKFKNIIIWKPKAFFKHLLHVAIVLMNFFGVFLLKGLTQIVRKVLGVIVHESFHLLLVHFLGGLLQLIQ